MADYEIKKFVQGDAQTSCCLYAMIGKWTVSRIFHQHMGMAIVADSGDIWHVATDAKDNALGFSLSYFLKKKSVHIRFLHAERPDIFSPLLETVTKMAEEYKMKEIKTYDRKYNDFWKENGFVRFDRKKGSFCKWVKIL